jgi:diguanylate cyclase (GGDEF)-like protein
VRVLLVEDNATDALVATGLLSKDPEVAFSVDRVTSLDAGLERLVREAFDVVLLDLTLGDSEGLATFLAVRNRAPAVPVVVVTGQDDETLGRAAVQAGAQDFLTKGRIEPRQLARSLQYAIDRHRRAQGEGLIDPLVQLPGKGLLTDRLKEALVRIGSEPRYVAVLWVGLGRLDALAEQLGRSAADAVLVQAAGRLRESLRPTDTLARVGADEFAMVVEGLARPANAERAGRKVLGDLSLQFDVSGTKVRVSPSVGVSHGRGSDDATSLLGSARDAMLAVRSADGQGLRMAEAGAR